MQIHVFDNRHISKAISNVNKGDTIVLIDRLSLKRWSKYFKYNNINETNLEVKYITQEEFFKLSKKFDVVLMNPPYLKRKWFKFVEKAATLNPKKIATINPDPTNNESDFGNAWKEFCITNGIVHREDVTHQFPGVSSGKISSFIFDRESGPNLELLKPDDAVYNSILTKVTVNIPTSFVIRGKQEVSGYGDKNKAFSLRETQTSTHLYPCIMSCNNNGLTIKYSDTLSSSKKHSNNLQGRFVIMNRFFGKNNPDPVYIIDQIQDYNIGYDCLAFKLEENETLTNFLSVYSSKLYRYVMNTMRNGGFDITQSNFMKFYRFDLTKTWTDQEIYQYLNISQEEIDYIEANVK